jgi:signal transduction histidine kinase
MEHLVQHLRGLAPTRYRSNEKEFQRSVDFHATMLAIAGQDLRQELQIILGTYEWLSRRLNDALELARVEQGRHGVKRMAEKSRQLVGVLHLYQKRKRIERVPVQLGPLFSVIRSDTAELALQRGVEHRLVPTGAVIVSDPVLIGSALENIVRNALRFTSSDGRVLLGVRQRGQRIHIEVHDTGIGIAADQFGEYLRHFIVWIQHSRMDLDWGYLLLGMRSSCSISRSRRAHA